MNYGLSRTERLRKTSQFLHVRQSGKSIKCAPFWLQLTSGKEERSMIGVIASKRLGNAVLRNRAKRLVRELYRKNKKLFPQNSNIVIIPRKGIFHKSFKELENTLIDVIGKASTKL